MVVVLIVAALISLALQDYINATAIFAIVAFNAILGGAARVSGRAGHRRP